jgi:hypothetical protein
VLSPKSSPRGKLMSEYVCVRITRMDDVDIALFDRDWNNTIYFFMMNADEQIYLRYGGRDSAAAETYLNLESLELALAKGLELHGLYQKGGIKKAERPKPLFPREFPLLVERTFQRNACVECHLIGDFQNLHREQDGTLNKLTHLYRSPDIKTLGIHLDVPKGLVVKEPRDAVQSAGMRAGDRITAINGTPVWTFADLQYYYDKTPRNARSVAMTVDRDGKPIDLDIALPARWWWTDLTFRQSSVEPRPYFESDPLSESDKRKYGLKLDGLASQVKYVNQYALIIKSHSLQVGDIIFGVDGIESHEYANTPELLIRLIRNPGDRVTLDVIRHGKKLKMELKTHRMAFRK